jgi:hypothetical protein
MAEEQKPAAEPQKQQDKPKELRFTKGETLPTIQVDVPMPTVKPPKVEAVPPPAAKPRAQSTGDSKQSTESSAEK